jgi:hypothetical protein
MRTPLAQRIKVDRTLARRLLPLAVPVALYGATRLLQVAVLWWMLPPQGPGLRTFLLHRWDGELFLRLAREGYPRHPNSHFDLPTSQLAFFPLFPKTVRALVRVTGAPYDLTGLAVVTAFGVAAAVLVYLLGADLYDRRVGAALVVLLCAQPLSIVLSMPYTEAPFLAFAAGMLLALRRRAWLVAGACCFLAGLTRPTGLATSATLVLAALVVLWRIRRRVEDTSAWRVIVGTAVGVTAVPAYLLWVGYRMGRLDGWFELQRDGWHQRFDGGVATTRTVLELARDDVGWHGLTLSILLVIAVVLTLVAVVERVWWPMLVYGVGVLVLTLGADGIFGVKARYLVPALVPLVPPAVALGRARWATATLVLILYALLGTWYGAKLLVVGGHPV